MLVTVCKTSPVAEKIIGQLVSNVVGPAVQFVIHPSIHPSGWWPGHLGLSGRWCMRAAIRFTTSQQHKQNCDDRQVVIQGNLPAMGFLLANNTQWARFSYSLLVHKCCTVQDGLQGAV
jgi:hypothetical protein